MRHGWLPAALIAVAACDEPPPPVAAPPVATATAVPYQAPTGLDRPLTTADLQHGRERFAIFCTPCHGHLGEGDGMVPRAGFPPPPSMHSERLRVMPLEYFVALIAEGFGPMPSYADQIDPPSRLAIAGYIRALQLSQHVPAAELPAADRERLPEP